MIKRFLQRSGGVFVLVGVLLAGVVIGGGAMLAFMQGNIDDLVSTVQAQGATQEATEPGILIAGVVADSPAAEAGVVRGDILLEVNDEAVNTVLDLRTLLADLEPDATVTLTVLHGDDERTLSANLEDRDGRGYLGVIPCAGPHVGSFMVRPGVEFFAAGGKTVVIDVVPDGPAAEAGIEQGDVIVAVGEQALDADNGLAAVIEGYEPGDVVTIELERDGATETVMVTLGEHPDQADRAFLGVSYGPRIELDRRGMRQRMESPGRFFFRALPGEDIRPFELPEGANVQEGAIIHQVAEDSPAAEAGLQAGQIITAIDGEAVLGPRFLVELIAGHAPGDTLTLTIAEKASDDSGDEAGARDVTVTLGEDPDQAGKAYLGIQLGRFFRFRQSAPGVDEEGVILEWFDQAAPGVRWHSNTSELPDGLDFTLDSFSIDMLPGGLSFEGDAPLSIEGIPAIPLIDGSL